jgi:osmotically-inducible protein OsmY
MKTFTCTLALAAALCACRSDRYRDRHDDYDTHSSMRSDVDGRFATADTWDTESDRTLAQSVRNALANDDALAFGARDIAVGVKDGKVRLSGYVTTEEERERAERCVRRIDGVRAVDNALDLKRD